MCSYTLYEDNKKYYVSLARKWGKRYRHHVPILLLRNTHATLMNDFDTFLRRYTRTKSTKVKFSRTCLRQLDHATPRTTHEESCTAKQTVSLPENTNEKIKFKNFAHGYPPSHIGFYDIEALQIPGLGRSDSVVYSLSLRGGVCHRG